MQMSDLQTQLSQEMAQMPWSDLIPHAKRDSLILVNHRLNLLEVGVAVAKDNATLVNQWISEGLLAKPTQQQLSLWNDLPEQKFNTIIVQPFVLISQLSA
jgi:hypothetical protein